METFCWLQRGLKQLLNEISPWTHNVYSFLLRREMRKARPVQKFCIAVGGEAKPSEELVGERKQQQGLMEELQDKREHQWGFPSSSRMSLWTENSCKRQCWQGEGRSCRAWWSRAGQQRLCLSRTSLGFQRQSALKADAMAGWEALLILEKSLR